MLGDTDGKGVKYRLGHQLSTTQRVISISPYIACYLTSMHSMVNPRLRDTHPEFTYLRDNQITEEVPLLVALVTVSMTAIRMALYISEKYQTADMRHGDLPWRGMTTHLKYSDCYVVL
jgi:hypothetical protein